MMEEENQQICPEIERIKAILANMVKEKKELEEILESGKVLPYKCTWGDDHDRPVQSWAALYNMLEEALFEREDRWTVSLYTPKHAEEYDKWVAKCDIKYHEDEIKFLKSKLNRKGDSNEGS